MKGLRDKMRAVQEENSAYRASNKAAEFEARVQVRDPARPQSAPWLDPSRPYPYLPYPTL